MKNTCLTVSKICKVTVHSGCQMVYVGSRVISNVILTVSMFDISPSRMLSCESQPDCCTQVQGVPCQIIHRWLQTHLSGTFSDYPRLLHGAYLELDFVPWVICLQYIYIYIYIYIYVYIVMEIHIWKAAAISVIPMQPPFSFTPSLPVSCIKTF